jgi:hypothetical protein
MPIPLVAPIFVAGATAAIGYFFQENAKTIAEANQKNQEELTRARLRREAELTRAQDTFTEVVTAMDKLYFYLAPSIYVAWRHAEGKTQDDDAANWGGLEAALVTWGQNKTRFATLVSQYFGATTYERLRHIDLVFADAMAFVNETYHNTEIHKAKKLTYENHKKKHFQKVGHHFEDYMFKFSEALIQDLQSQNIGFMRRTESARTEVAGGATALT